MSLFACMGVGTVKVEMQEEIIPHRIYKGSWKCPNCHIEIEDERGQLIEMAVNQNGKVGMCFWFTCPHCDQSFEYSLDAKEVQT